MTHYYSPHTGEIIATDQPAPWMLSTELQPPTYDPATQSAFFQNGAWAVIDAAPPEVQVPSIVSMRQARLALLSAGLLSNVNAAVAAMPGLEGDAARVEWEYAQDVRRDSPLVQSLAAALNLSPSAVDALFVAAAVL